jgi:hypothetical protein
VEKMPPCAFASHAVHPIRLHLLAHGKLDLPGELVRLGVQVDHDALLAGWGGRVGLAPLAIVIRTLSLDGRHDLTNRANGSVRVGRVGRVGLRGQAGIIGQLHRRGGERRGRQAGE